MIKHKLYAQLNRWIRVLPSNWQPTLRARFFGLLHAPLILFCAPSVPVLEKKRSVVKIPLGYRTRNHVGSMYFGALAVGADLAAGLLAQWHIEQSGGGIELLFKDFKADFRRRPTSAVFFTCEQGEAIEALVKEVKAVKERRNLPVVVVASIREQGSSDAIEVATFELTLSLRARA
jgi:acyl-coenzyme A thioesterase PaaI-like protein